MGTKKLVMLLDNWKWIIVIYIKYKSEQCFNINSILYLITEFKFFASELF